MADAYIPSNVEPGYDDWWNACGLFKADNKDEKAVRYTLCTTDEPHAVPHSDQRLTASLPRARVCACAFACVCV
jgi:hypothetical protein